MAKIKTGNVYRLADLNRLVIVESVVYINNIKLIVIYPLSHAIYLACDEDFIIMGDKLFKEAMMAEMWNRLAVPAELLTNYIGRLSGKYHQAFSSFVYFKHQGCKNKFVKPLTGPPLRSNTDIRYLFRMQEIEEFAPLREPLISDITEKEEV